MIDIIEQKPFIVGNHVVLRPLFETDINGRYPEWFNDAEVCFGNSHHVYPYLPGEAVEFIQSLTKKRDMLVLAILNKNTGEHIGNISLQEINFIYRDAELAILLGEKSCWGQGFGKEAVFLLVAHGFKALNLHRISCGTFLNNIAMQKIALSIGMRLEGTRRQAVFKDGVYYDMLEYGILKNEFEAVVHKTDDKMIKK
jgi:RimJ/RimL family protein N-acetyltransferase